MTRPAAPAPQRFLPNLEGLRAVAAGGIVLTHVAFQTGLDPATPVGAIAARADFFVAVFFALSAFVLTRRYGQKLQPGEYYRRRIVRIMPAYLVYVLVAVAALPAAVSWLRAAGWVAGSRSLTATAVLAQVYVPAALLPGMTHLWSLSVEVAFYAVFPAVIMVLRRVRRPVAWVCAASVASLGWGFLPGAQEQAPLGAQQLAHWLGGWPNAQLWPPAFVSWFGVGLMLALVPPEAAPRWLRRAARHRALWWCAAMGVMWLAAQPWFGPVGLGHPTPAQFVRKVAAGAVVAALVMVPAVLGGPSRVLQWPPVQAVGRWSYSLFLWHLLVLELALPLLGKQPFIGGFLPVLGLVMGVSVVVAAASYTLIECPARRLCDARRAQGPQGGQGGAAGEGAGAGVAAGTPGAVGEQYAAQGH